MLGIATTEKEQRPETCKGNRARCASFRCLIRTSVPAFTMQQDRGRSGQAGIRCHSQVGIQVGCSFTPMLRSMMPNSMITDR